MKNSYTEIAFILDRSGSMQSCQDAAIEGFNRFLLEQQQSAGMARLTLVLFDNEYLVPVASLPVQEVLALDQESYLPRGSTALLDAIARGVDELGARLGQLPEADRPAQVIVAILTDGHENSSQHFGWQDVALRIKHQTEVYKWTFLFLAANQDAIATAAQMNIPAANAASYVADDAGSRASHRAFSRKMAAMRQVNRGEACLEETIDAAASLSDLVQEEDQKERAK